MPRSGSRGLGRAVGVGGGIGWAGGAEAGAGLRRSLKAGRVRSRQGWVGR